MSSSYSDLNEVYARHNVNYNLSIDDNIKSIIDLLQPKLEQNYQKTALRMGQARPPCRLNNSILPVNALLHFYNLKG